VISSSSGPHVALAGYILGEARPEEVRVVEQHLASCLHCRDEVSSLAAMEKRLLKLPPEAALDGPPDEGDPLLQRILSQARRDCENAETRTRT
jgi:anti-sigma factor RsiW